METSLETPKRLLPLSLDWLLIHDTVAAQYIPELQHRHCVTSVPSPPDHLYQQHALVQT